MRTISIVVLLGSAIFLWELAGNIMSQDSPIDPKHEPTFEEMLIEDLGATPEQLHDLSGAAIPVFAGLDQKMGEITFGDILSSAAEKETVVRAMSDIQGAMYDAILDSHDQLKQAAGEYLPEAMIKKFEERMFQMNFGNWGNRLTFNEDGTITNRDDTAGNIMCGTYDVLQLTPEQKRDFHQILKEANGELHELLFDLEVRGEFYGQIHDLKKKLSTAQTDEEKKAIKEEIKKITAQCQSRTTELTKKISDKINQKIDKILTGEQKALKQKLLAEMPDYIWRARDENQGKKHSWRPNIDSWRPGQGVPKNLENHPAETRIRKNEDGKKRFPGNEEKPK
ncbi:MAG: hypothetical protein FWC50_00200 [Planctomycetaceae bacterium]|nr:hypothetical protein [Planctomycetaceae bacterium]